MIKVTDLSTANAIQDLDIRQVVLDRIAQLEEQGFELHEVGHFLIVESTDTVEEIQQHLGVPIGAYDLIDHGPVCTCVVYVLGQDGAGIEEFIPHAANQHELLALLHKGQS